MLSPAPPSLEPTQLYTGSCVHGTAGRRVLCVYTESCVHSMLDLRGAQIMCPVHRILCTRQVRRQGKSINESINELIDQSINRSIAQTMNPAILQTVSQPLSRGINCNLCPQYTAWRPVPGSSESTLDNLLLRGTILCTRHGKHELTPESINQVLSFKLYSSTATSGMLSARWPVSGAHAPCEIRPPSSSSEAAAV